MAPPTCDEQHHLARLFACSARPVAQVAVHVFQRELCVGVSAQVTHAREVFVDGAGSDVGVQVELVLGLVRVLQQAYSVRVCGVKVCVRSMWGKQMNVVGPVSNSCRDKKSEFWNIMRSVISTCFCQTFEIRTEVVSSNAGRFSTPPTPSATPRPAPS